MAEDTNTLNYQISRVVGGHNDTLKSILVKLGISSASTAKADTMNALVDNMNIPVGSGGTGKKTWAVNRLIYPSAATTLAQLVHPTTAGSFLRQGTSGAPYWTVPADVAAAIGASKIQTGTYTGTGTAGTGRANTLTFSFVPKLVLIQATNNVIMTFTGRINDANWLLLVNGVASAYVKQGSDGASATTLTVSWNSTTVSWYHDYSTPYAPSQLNTQGTVYQYVAIG